MMVRRFLFVMCLAALSLPAGATLLKNEFLQVSVDPETARFSVKDLRTGQTWEQSKVGYVRLSEVSVSNHRLRAVLAGPDGVTARLAMELLPDSAELLVRISAEADQPIARRLAYPYPFLPDEQDLFILPEHEGVGIPVSDFGVMDKKYASEHVAAPVYNKLYRFFCGHDLSMTFWGYAGKTGSVMSIVETPDDAALRVQTVDQKLAGGIEWDSSRGQWGYDRAIRYVFIAEGGYNAMCKRYRTYAADAGLFKTLAEKAEQNPDALAFAKTALVWIFSPHTDVLVPQMLESGMDHISVTGPMFTPGEIQRMNEAGVLNGIYDCMRSVLPSDYMDKVRRVDPTDVRDAYSDDIILMENGEPFNYGWPKGGIDGKTYRTLDVCDLKKGDYARARLDQDLKHRPMSIRFYDTITAFPWTECYDPKHPTTRSQVRSARMDVLKHVVDDRGMVLGAEAGHIFAVPYAAYFEGMNHSRFFYYQIKGHPLYVYDREKEIPAEFRVAMDVEHKYRLPLWELVNHDACVAHTRWNTPNNKIHSDEWWDHMDRWNILYATPPMYMFINESVSFWETYKKRYLKSYRDVVEGVILKTAGQEMIRHDFLTEDKSVQRTCFANGVEITVNFGSEPFVTEGGGTVAPGGHLVVSP